MKQTSLNDLFDFTPDAPAEKPDAFAIMRDLTKEPCLRCELGLQSPNNPGFLWRGNPQGHVAIVGDVPTYIDMSSRKAFADEQGTKFIEWMKEAEMPVKDVFFSYIVQCMTPSRESKVKDKPMEQRPPSRSKEINRCFPNRCLRVLQSLPNLEVIWLHGLVTMKTVLGGDPQIKSHTGFWFGSDLLPGKAIFCLPHPRDFDNTTGEVKKGRLKQQLSYFRNEYYGMKDDNGVYLVPARKIMSILDYREKERHR